MKALVVYDSMYGNTEQIATAIGSGITGDVSVLRAGEVEPQQLEAIDLLVVGSPTQAGRATMPVQTFLSEVAAPAVKGVRVAAFDTRIPTKWVMIFGYAAGRIARSLKNSGGNLVAAPEPFFVNGKEGPLQDGELGRASSWGKTVAGS
ncbi:MAG TPA: flavodoxin family protein [Dehalococcoidia bacterium]|nr:flavodoxin family protein [Dehalococcoidia bacterium]